jgi:Uma2 family endonuclease
MRLMNVPTTDDVLDAAEHLPFGATLVIHEFGWDDYERLLETIGDRPRWRISYDSGRLEILSPSPLHDKYGRLMDRFVVTFCEIRGLSCECYGGPTWKSKALGKGVEPDACYYIKNAHRVIGKRDIKLESDPPPDVCVEVDLTRSSLRQLSIYAALAVPEMWRFHGDAVTFYALAGEKYAEIPESLILPGLTGPMIVEAIEDCDTRGQMKALKTFRRRLRASK